MGFNRAWPIIQPYVDRGLIKAAVLRLMWLKSLSVSANLVPDRKPPSPSDEGCLAGTFDLVDTQ